LGGKNFKEFVVLCFGIFTRNQKSKKKGEKKKLITTLVSTAQHPPIIA
jgi:hypothetical protein